MEKKVNSDSPAKYLKNLVRSDEIIGILSEMLKFQKTAEVSLYPVFLEEITDLLIDMKTIVEQYAVQYEYLENENTRLRRTIADYEQK